MEGSTKKGKEKPEEKKKKKESEKKEGGFRSSSTACPSRHPYSVADTSPVKDRKQENGRQICGE